MRILVLGAAGQLGRELAPLLERRGHAVDARSRAQLDITSREQLRRALEQGGYQRVVNCAAYTQVDRAEDEPELAFRLNGEAPGTVAAACAEFGVPLCHISTDFVFGQPPSAPPRPWREIDPPQPRGVYAESKRAGEVAVRNRLSQSYVVRTSWLYGNRGPNFPLAICGEAARQRQLRVVADQVGTPTWTGSLAPALADLLETDKFGLYHLSNSGEASWHQFALELVAVLDLKTEVQAVTTAEWGAKAPRPSYSVLDNAAWRTLGMPALSDWRSALGSYLESEREGALAQALGARGG